MKCVVCKREFRDNERVIPVARFIANYKRGDFLADTGNEAMHLKCAVGSA